MSFEIQDHLDIKILEQEICGVDEDRKTTVLFAICHKILAAALSSEIVRQRIFEQRQRLAELFRNHGGERHVANAQMFEELAEPDSILKYVPERMKAEKKPPERKIVPKPQPLYFYVFGESMDESEPLDKMETARMKIFANNQGRRMVSLGIDFEHLLNPNYELDRRYNIYIKAPLDNRLCAQLNVLFLRYPKLIEKMFVLTWKGKTPVLQPLRDNEYFRQFTNTLVRKNDVLEEAQKFMGHRLNLGEIFYGCVKGVTDFGWFVEITPGIEGLVHTSKVPKKLRNCLKEGSLVTVMVEEITINGDIRLSIEKALEEACEVGRWQKKPVFGMETARALQGGMERLLLTEGGSKENEK